MDRINKRNSNIELLRIIAMVFIIAHHYTVHGGFNEVTVNNVSFATAYISTISMFGKVGCSLFALATGYFFVSKETDIKQQIKRIIPIALEMVFYSLLAVAIAYFVKPSLIDFKVVLNNLLPFFRGNWYVRSYIFFCLFIPFINTFIKSLNKEKFDKLILLLIVVWIIISTFFGFGILDVGYLGFMLFCYFFGAYSKLYVVGEKKYNNKINLYISLIAFALIILSVYTFDILGYVTKIDTFISHERYFMPWNSILSFTMAYFLFIYFANLSFNNKSINVVSSTTTGIYLLHDNPLMMTVIWEIWYPNKNYANNPYLHSILKILAVFVIGMVIDLLRQKIFDNKVKSMIDKHFDSIYEKIEIKIKKVLSLIG